MRSRPPINCTLAELGSVLLKMVFLMDFDTRTVSRKHDETNVRIFVKIIFLF